MEVDMTRESNANLFSIAFMGASLICLKNDMYFFHQMHLQPFLENAHFLREP